MLVCSLQGGAEEAHGSARRLGAGREGASGFLCRGLSSLCRDLCGSCGVGTRDGGSHGNRKQVLLTRNSPGKAEMTNRNEEMSE